MNMFFKLLLPQMLEQFKENASDDVLNKLIPDVLKNQTNQKEIEELCKDLKKKKQNN